MREGREGETERKREDKRKGIGKKRRGEDRES